MPLILGTNSIKDTGYNVANSLRFDDGSTDYLSGPNTNAGSTKTKFTFSAWVKRANITPGNDDLLIGKWSSGNDRGHINFSDSPDDCISFFEKASGSTTTNFKTSRLFRDPSAWFHVVFIGDTTQGTESNRLKIYINGAQETSFSTATYPSQSYEWQLQAIAKNFGIGAFAAENAGASPSSFYLAEVVYLDGVAGSIGDFGEFDEDSPNIWKPKDVSGLTFGTNGFYLEFKESGTSQNSSGLGADTSGNDNHFAVNNLTSVDQSIDTCTNNFATMNPLHSGAVTFAEGNLQVSRSGSGQSWLNSLSTFAPTSGKWYVELKVNSVGSNGLNMGFANFDLSNLQNITTSPGEDATSAGLYSNNGPIFYASGTTFATTGTPGGIVQLAMDLDNGYLYWGDDNTYLNSANPASGSSGTGGLALSNLTTGGSYGIVVAARNGGDVSFNFGSPPFSISSGNADANGFGNFEYAPPSGYFALCSKNLAENG